MPFNSIVGLPMCSEVCLTMQETLGWEDPLEKKMATKSSILSGESHGQRSVVGYRPWGWIRVGSLVGYRPWDWIRVGSLVGYRPWGWIRVGSLVGYRPWGWIRVADDLVTTTTTANIPLYMYCILGEKIS